MDARTRSLLVGFGGGIAAALALPILKPIVTEVARPVTKALLRNSLLSLDYLRTHGARLSETIEDLVAEVSAEVKAELDRRANEAAGGAAIVSTLRDQGDGGSAAKGSAPSGAKSVS